MSEFERWLCSVNKLTPDMVRLKLAFEAGQKAERDKVQKHIYGCVRCGDCDELDALVPEGDS